MRTWLRNLGYQAIRYIVDRRDARSQVNTTFPTAQGHNYLSDPMFADASGDGFYTKLYAEDAENPIAIDYKRFKTEIVLGSCRKAGKWHEIEIMGPAALPYAITNADYFNARGEHTLDVSFGGQSFTFRNLVSERFYYLPIPRAGQVKLRCDFDLVVGKPISTVQTKRHRKKLVVVLFVDNFTQDILDLIDFDKDLPNISRFFGKGMIFDNCFSCSNWTLPSVASMMSGKSAAQHRMVHPRNDVVVGDGYQLMSEVLHEDGFLTFQACGNWRKSPRYGYAKGYDRTVYRNQLSVSDTLDALYSQLRAFPDRDTFAWISLFDLHHSVALVPDIAVQLDVSLPAHDFFVEDAKTPLQLGQSMLRVERYVAELKRIDFHLGQFFSWLENNYAEEDFLVALSADHGTTFVTEDTHKLARERCHIAFMVRGGGIPMGRTDELVQHSDLLPLIAKFAGVMFEGDGDGRVPESLGGPPARSYVCTEILYPGEPYSASLWDHEFNFQLEAAGPVSDHGQPDFRSYTMELFRRDDPLIDVSDKYPERLRSFEEAVRARFDAI